MLWKRACKPIQNYRISKIGQNEELWKMSYAYWITHPSLKSDSGDIPCKQRDRCLHLTYHPTYCLFPRSHRAALDDLNFGQRPPQVVLERGEKGGATFC